MADMDFDTPCPKPSGWLADALKDATPMTPPDGPVVRQTCACGKDTFTAPYEACYACRNRPHWDGPVVTLRNLIEQGFCRVCQHDDAVPRARAALDTLIETYERHCEDLREMVQGRPY